MRDICYSNALNQLFAADFDGNRVLVFNRTATGVENSKEAHMQFALSQNYPNPFNPSTNISFSLTSQSYVSLKVFDLIGREVATLVSEKLSAGNHTRQWNAYSMPSGVYFYRLSVHSGAAGTGSFTETKKLLLLK